MDPLYYSGTFGFQKGGVGTSSGTVIVGNAEMANYPYEVEIMSRRNQGRTESGDHWCYENWKDKRAWETHWVMETPETTAMMASFFNSSATFRFNPNVGESAWYECRCVTTPWAPKEEFIDLWGFDVRIEEI